MKKLERKLKLGMEKNYRYGIPNRLATELTVQFGISPGEEQTRLLRKIMKHLVEGPLRPDSTPQEIIDTIKKDGLDQWLS